jgi:DNA-binding response OmpR family regulator
VELLMLTSAADPCEVIPALSLLAHEVRRASSMITSAFDGPPHDAVLIDARSHPAHAAELCGRIRARRPAIPLVAVVSENGLGAQWSRFGIDQLMLSTAGPAEIDARLRLLRPRPIVDGRIPPGALVVGDLVLDDRSITALLGGRKLDLTRREFELLWDLAQRAGEPVTRAQLLHTAWANHTERTVDVHIGRIRDKLGPEYSHLIRTIRYRGYKLIAPDPARRAVSIPAVATDTPRSGTART